MGYTTEFDGRFEFSKPLTDEQAEEFNLFCTQRHGNNISHGANPSFWCDWETDGKGMFWNESEKSYGMDDWARVLVEKFLKPWGVELKGHIYAQGEERNDRWAMIAEGHNIKRARVQLVAED